MQETTLKTIYRYDDYSLNLPKTCYLPSDDTFLLLDALKKEALNNYKNALELGFGSGIISLYLSKKINMVDCCDINEDVIDYFKNLVDKENLNINVIKSNLFTNINKKYDVIVFNPPYVPSEKINLKDKEAIATDGGKEGSEIIHQFLKNLNKFLKKEGVCYLLISSLNNPERIIKNIKKEFSVKIINKKKLFFEELLILKILK